MASRQLSSCDFVSSVLAVYFTFVKLDCVYPQNLFVDISIHLNLHWNARFQEDWLSVVTMGAKPQSCNQQFQSQAQLQHEWLLTVFFPLSWLESGYNLYKTPFVSTRNAQEQWWPNEPTFVK